MGDSRLLDAAFRRALNERPAFELTHYCSLRSADTSAGWLLYWFSALARRELFEHEDARMLMTGKDAAGWWSHRLAPVAIALLLLALSVVALHGDGGAAKAESLAQLVGDVDCSKSVDSRDAALVLQYNAGRTRQLRCLHNAQARGTDDVSALDAMLILQYSAALIDHLPPIRSFLGTITVVQGIEAQCLALDTGREQLVLFNPSGLHVGQVVRITGYIDAFASFCGISPILHN